jgi:ATP-binding cassette subfamily B protein
VHIHIHVHIHVQDGLSPGKLITYQLYWNMMVGAFKGLLDILTSFTRAGGAASRVFNMIDSLPDIDIDSGFSVTTAATSTTAAPSDADTSAATADGGIRDLKGAIEMRGVCFAYQMRPDAQVLTDVSLTVPAASVCAIVGKSGGGKVLYT